MIDKSLITVIIATYNAGDVLSTTLRSLDAQSFKNFEVILVDAKSNDETLIIASQYKELITKIISEKDNGIADAWNKGVAFAKGDWIIFVNAGDVLHRDHFMRFISSLDDSKSNSVFYCNVFKFDKNNTIVSYIKGTKPDLNKIRLGGIGFGHPGSFISKRICEEIGRFNENLKIAIDSEYLMRCFKAKYNFYYFESNAYMQTGGLSDVLFSKAIDEYSQAAEFLGLISHYRGKLLRVFLPKIRILVHIFRKCSVIFRSIKHFLVHILNFLPDFIPVNSLRKFLFYCAGFRLSKSSSIGFGSRFYCMNNFVMGDNSIVNRNCLFDNRDSIVIGDNVSISRNVSIFTAGHDINSPFFEMIKKPIFIGDHVVIFSKSIIMPGVKIGIGAVVQAGSVVVKNIEPFTIVGGNPAKVIGIRDSNLQYCLNYCYPLAM